MFTKTCAVLARFIALFALGDKIHSIWLAIGMRQGYDAAFTFLWLLLLIFAFLSFLIWLVSDFNRILDKAYEEL